MSPSFPFLSCSAPLQWSCSSPWLAAQNHTWSPALRRPPISTSKTFSPPAVPLQPPSGQGRPAGGSPSVSSGPGLASVGETAHSFWIAVQILLGCPQFSMTRRTDAGDCSVAEVTQVQHGNLDQEVQDKYLELVHLISRCHRLVLDLEGGGQFGVQLLQNPCHSPLPRLLLWRDRAATLQLKISSGIFKKGRKEGWFKVRALHWVWGVTGSLVLYVHMCLYYP